MGGRNKQSSVSVKLECATSVVRAQRMIKRHLGRKGQRGIRGGSERHLGRVREARVGRKLIWDEWWEEITERRGSGRATHNSSERPDQNRGTMTLCTGPKGMGCWVMVSGSDSL